VVAPAVGGDAEVDILGETGGVDGEEVVRLRADMAPRLDAVKTAGVDAAQQSTIINSILDWRDHNDDPLPGGAETSEYKSSAWLPHVAKNGPFDDMSELLLVKGITEQPQIYSKSFAQSGASLISRHSRLGASKFEQVAYETTLTDLFSTLDVRPLLFSFLSLDK